MQAAVVGACASLVAQLLTTPLDVIRTRVMSTRTSTAGDNGRNKLDEEEKEGHVGKSKPVTLGQLIQEEGWAGLTAGAGPRVVRAIGSGAIQFASYEITQNYLKK